MSRTSPYAKGNLAWGICQRCGQRALLNDLVLDGYYPLLRVHPECYDAKHPQERLPKVSDAQVLWRPSPEQGAIAPVLSLAQSASGVELTWTAADWYGGPSTSSYAVYRKAGSSDYGLIATLAVTLSDVFADTDEPLSYVDSSVVSGTTYTYEVVALDSYSRQLASNEVSITIASFATTPVAFINAAGTSSYVYWLASTAPSPQTISSYRVYRSVNSSAYSLVQDSAATSFTDSISRYTTYSYYVVAVTSTGSLSANSNIVECYTRFDGQWHVQPSGAIVSSASNPIGGVITPNGQFMYVANYQFTTSVLYQYRIGADGKLTALSPSSVTIGQATLQGVVKSDGRHLYYPSDGSLVTGVVYQYSISADGKLTAKTPATVSCSANNPSSPKIYNNQYLYVVCGGFNGGSFPGADNKLVVFSIDSSTGALTRITNVATVNGCRSLDIYTPGPYLYLISYSTAQAQVAQFTIGSDGIPVAMSTASFNTSQASSGAGIFVDEVNALVYAAMTNGSTDVYRIGSTGALTLITTITSPSLVHHPVEDFLYGISGSSILEYAQGVNGTPAALSPSSVVTSHAVDGGIAITPDGLYGYALQRTSNTIEQFYLT